MLWLVLHDESLRPPPAEQRDVHLLRGLLLSFQALRAAAMAYEAERVRACTPADLFGLPLPGGGTLGAALGTLRRQDPESARRLQNILTGGRNREDLEAEEDPAAQTGSVTYQGGASAALQAAWRYEGVVWSADREEWRAAEIDVEVRQGDGEPRPAKLLNLWSAEVRPVHRRRLEARGLVAVPDYENPGRHDPEGRTPEQQREYIQFRGRKSEMPRRAEDLLRRSVPVEGKVCYWALCEHGFFHRFEGSLRGDGDGWPQVHWNGTTDPRACGNRQEGGRTTDEHVPAPIRERLQFLGPTGECGCR